MRKVQPQELAQALETLGLRSGSAWLVHSAIQFLGLPAGGSGMYFQALDAALGLSAGQEGTLAVPTFNFAFARGEAYDPVTTPSEKMGAFSEAVRLLPQAKRTPHPLQSLAVVGHWAGDLAGRDTPGAFDPGSAFERMLELDFGLLLLGASVQAVSMVHYSEQRAGVPYRYWKTFSGRVKQPQGWELRSYRMFVRDLQLNPQLDLSPIQHELQRLGLWRSVPINYGSISACKLRDFVCITDQLLAQDPLALVSKA